MPKPRFLSLLALLVCAIALTACGGGSSSSGDSPQKVLKETFASNHSKKVKSGNINVSFHIDAQGSSSLKGPVDVSFAGPFESMGDKKLPKFSFAVTAQAQGQNFSAGATSTGDKGFVNFQKTDYAVPAQLFQQFRQSFEQAQNQSANKQENLFKRLNIDPSTWLKDSKNQGEEDLNGEKVVHISGTVDVPKMLDDVNRLATQAGKLGVPNTSRLPSQITPAQRDKISRAVKSATVDVFSGSDDKILRKFNLDLKLDLPADLQKQANGLTTADVRMSAELRDLNQTQPIKAPANTRPLSDLTGSLGALGALGGAGGSSGGSSSGGSSTPGGSATNSQQVQKYSKCLQDAGNDVAKAQKCADLIK